MKVCNVLKIHARIAFLIVLKALGVCFKCDRLQLGIEIKI